MMTYDELRALKPGLKALLKPRIGADIYGVGIAEGKLRVYVAHELTEGPLPAEFQGADIELVPMDPPVAAEKSEG